MLILFFAFFMKSGEPTHTPVRGLLPSLISRYDESRNFTCLDNRLQIPFSFVNDNYCDCVDGSDEPGTNACNYYFYCLNEKFEGKNISSMLVNDGICDCCDGSDEYDGKISCPNTCREEAEKKKEIEAQRVRTYIEGSAIRQMYIETRKTYEEEYPDVLSNFTGLYQELMNKKSALLAKKEKIEAAEMDAKIAFEAKLQSERQRKEAMELDKEAKKVFDDLDIDEDQKVTADELLQHAELEAVTNFNYNFTLEDAKTILNGDFVDFENFKNVYINIRHLYVFRNNKSEEARDSHEESSGGEADNEEKSTESLSDSEKENLEHVDNHSEKIDYDEKTLSVIAEADKIRKEYEEWSAKADEMERKLAEMTKLKDFDFGTDGEYFKLANAVYEFNDKEYTYQLFMFKEVLQVPVSGGRSISLGSWHGWRNRDNKKHGIMIFANGESCWNGPARSIHVDVVCGLTERITAVSEPQRCFYQMEFETPAACDMSDLPPHMLKAHSGHDEL